MLIIFNCKIKYVHKVTIIKIKNIYNSYIFISRTNKSYSELLDNGEVAGNMKTPGGTTLTGSTNSASHRPDKAQPPSGTHSPLTR